MRGYDFRLIDEFRVNLEQFGFVTTAKFGGKSERRREASVKEWHFSKLKQNLAD